MASTLNTCSSSNLDLFSVRPSVMAVVRFYSNEAVNGSALQRAAKLYPLLSVTAELCYNVELTGERPSVVTILTNEAASQFDTCKGIVCLSHTGCSSLSAEQKEVVLWLFRPPLQIEPLSEEPKLAEGNGQKLVEIGPRYPQQPRIPLTDASVAPHLTFTGLHVLILFWFFSPARQNILISKHSNRNQSDHVVSLQAELLHRLVHQHRVHLPQRWTHSHHAGGTVSQVSNQGLQTHLDNQ